MSWSWGVPPPSPPWYEHILPTLNTSHTGSSVEFDGTQQMLGRKSSENLTFFFAILFIVYASLLFGWGGVLERSKGIEKRSDHH